MGLITKNIKVKWHPNNKKWYENKGYKFTNYGDAMTISVNDLSDGSGIYVEVQCENCKEIRKIQWYDYIKKYKTKDNTMCKNCILKLFTVEKSRVKKLTNGTSFEKWCIDNNRQDILNRWDYDLNSYKPNEIGHSSNKKFWIKCPTRIHESELRSINFFTSGDSKLICNKCNSVGQYLINNYGSDALEKFWGNKNIKNAFEIPHGSHTKIWIKCQNCKNEQLISYPNFERFGLGCHKCSDGISYGEKFIYELLKQLELNFTTEMIFNWCKSKRYDVYIPNESIIIEIHGLQHYKNSARGRTLLEEQENDNIKELSAKENGILHYIIIDARCSELDYIKNSIMESSLQKVLKFKVKDIDWLKCHEFACKSFVKLACDLWNSGIKSMPAIANELNRCRNTVKRYIKQGTKLNWCDYDPDEEVIKNNINKSKEVYCIELDKIFDSIHDAGRKLNIGFSSLSAVLNGKGKTINGYHFMYYNDYLNGKNVDMSYGNNKKVICLTTGKVYESIIIAGTNLGINSSNIGNCCMGKRKTTHKLQWMYYEDFLELHNNKLQVS